jgi:hypothetical protein
VHSNFIVKNLYSVLEARESYYCQISVYEAVTSECVHYFPKLDTGLLSTLYANELLSNGVVDLHFCFTMHGRQIQFEFEVENFYKRK